MSVYQRKDVEGTSWMIDFTYNDPVTGAEKRYRRAAGKDVRLKRDALAAERALYDKLTAPPPKPEEVQKDAPFADFAGHWKDTRRADWKPTAYRGYEQILRVHLVPAFSGKTVRSITVEDVQRYKSDRLKKDELSPKTVNNHLGVLGSLFEDAVKWRYAVHNPVRQVKPCRVDRVDEDFDFWTAEESERFLAAIREVRPRWFPFFLTALRTGLRLGELAALRWGDVDFTSRKVHVRRSYSHGVETTPKSGKGRSVPMSAQLYTALAEHKLANGGNERVFLSDEGEILDNNRVKHPFWRGIEKAGVRRIRIHDLRHSFASQLVIAGESLFKVQRLLGHSEATMTQRYAHLRAEDLGESVGVLDNAEDSAAHLRHVGRGEGV
jgi:integrase